MEPRRSQPVPETQLLSSVLKSKITFEGKELFDFEEVKMSFFFLPQSGAPNISGTFFSLAPAVRQERNGPPSPFQSQHCTERCEECVSLRSRRFGIAQSMSRMCGACHKESTVSGSTRLDGETAPMRGMSLIGDRNPSDSLFGVAFPVHICATCLLEPA